MIASTELNGDCVRQKHYYLGLPNQALLSYLASSRIADENIAEWPLNMGW